MTGHDCPGLAYCATCQSRRDAIETGPLDSDVRAASDRGVAQLEAWTYAERRQVERRSEEPPPGAYMSRAGLERYERARRIRRMREDQRRWRTA